MRITTTPPGPAVRVRHSGSGSGLIESLKWLHVPLPAIDAAAVTLPGLVMERPLAPAAELRSFILRHYRRHLRRQACKTHDKTCTAQDTSMPSAQ